MIQSTKRRPGDTIRRLERSDVTKQHVGSVPIDPELRFLIGLSRQLPNVRGAGRVANALRRFYLRRPRQPGDVDVLDFRMRLDPAQNVDGALLFMPHLRDATEIRFLREHVKPGDIFIDAGANVGHYALVASRLVGAEGLVIAIEPDPETFHKLRVNLELSRARQVISVKAGLADAEGTMRLRVNPANRGGNTFLSPDELRLIPEFQGTCFDDSATTYVEDVPVQTLEHVLRVAGVDEVAGAKFDIEGFEYRVLRRFFSEAPPQLFPGFLIVEDKPGAEQGTGGNLIELITAHGYRPLGGRLGSSRNNYIMVRA